jgi:hypothetical protein
VRMAPSAELARVAANELSGYNGAGEEKLLLHGSLGTMTPGLTS